MDRMLYLDYQVVSKNIHIAIQPYYTHLTAFFQDNLGKPAPER